MNQRRSQPHGEHQGSHKDEPADAIDDQRSRLQMQSQPCRRSASVPAESIVLARAPARFSFGIAAVHIEKYFLEGFAVTRRDAQ